MAQLQQELKSTDNTSHQEPGHLGLKSSTPTEPEILLAPAVGAQEGSLCSSRLSPKHYQLLMPTEMSALCKTHMLQCGSPDSLGSPLRHRKSLG